LAVLPVRMKGLLLVKHLLRPAAVAEDGDAFAARFPGENVGLPYVLHGSLVGKVDGLADGVVHHLLKGSLHPDVPLRRDVMGGLEDPFTYFLVKSFLEGLLVVGVDIGEALALQDFLGEFQREDRLYT